jgi:uncharacterized protein YodC (DUF2158 family)
MIVDQFKEGDIVRQKSGGPKMTIDYLGVHRMGGDEIQALCSWFDGAKKQNDWFKLHSIKKAEE